jgi:hypothetical protein
MAGHDPLMLDTRDWWIGGAGMDRDVKELSGSRLKLVLKCGLEAW